MTEQDSLELMLNEARSKIKELEALVGSNERRWASELNERIYRNAELERQRDELITSMTWVANYKNRDDMIRLDLSGAAQYGVAFAQHIESICHAAQAAIAAAKGQGK